MEKCNSRYTGKFIPFKQKMHIKQGIKRKVYDNVRYTIPLYYILSFMCESVATKSKEFIYMNSIYESCSGLNII